MSFARDAEDYMNNKESDREDMDVLKRYRQNVQKAQKYESDPEFDTDIAKMENIFKKSSAYQDHTAKNQVLLQQQQKTKVQSAQKQQKLVTIELHKLNLQHK